MLRQMSKRARLEAIIHDASVSNAEDPVARLAKILSLTKSAHPQDSLTSYESAQLLAKSPPMDDAHYRQTLEYLNRYRIDGRYFRSWKDVLRLDPQILVLPPCAMQPHTFIANNRTYSDQQSHTGNSAIQFLDPRSGIPHTGFIQHIYSIVLELRMHTMIFVRPHKLLAQHDAEKAPFIHLFHFKTQLFDAESSGDMVVIEPQHIITHVTTLRRPIGTYGIDKETLAVCWAADRGRHRKADEI